ncbi:MAG: hypothetical protein AVDCRST_MAG48-3710, partial [uncultured Friedmanniella sp.]
GRAPRGPGRAGRPGAGGLDARHLPRPRLRAAPDEPGAGPQRRDLRRGAGRERRGEHQRVPHRRRRRPQAVRDAGVDGARLPGRLAAGWRSTGPRPSAGPVPAAGVDAARDHRGRGV